jgi:hypothetical protein
MTRGAIWSSGFGPSSAGAPHELAFVFLSLKEFAMFGFKRLKLVYALTTSVAFISGGCGDDPASCADDPTGPTCGGGDPENISRVTVTLTPIGGGAVATSSRFDPDGSQLPLPIGAATATLVLQKGKTYNGVLALLNDINPADIVDISAEVLAESEFHRFFYTLTCVGVTAPVAGQNTDSQTPPQPFGSTYQIVVDAAAPTNAACTLNIKLRHFENNKGDGTGTNFETDLDVDFPVSIQP